MTQEAFRLYREFAWGAEGLAPIAQQPTIGRNMQYPGVSIVAVMSTFAVMDLQEEWIIGEEWITTKMNVSECTQQVRPKDVITQYIGGLLSAYALCGKKKTVFLDRAREFLENLEPAINPSTGMLIYMYDNKKRVVSDHSWNIIGSVGFQQTELIFLANLTADLQLMDRLTNVQKLMSNITTVDDHRLPPNRVNVTTGAAISSTLRTFFEHNIDFCYDMLRSYIQRDRQDRSLLQLYTEAVDNTLKAGMFKLMDNGLLYVREYDSKSKRHSFGMSHLACQLGAMLAIGARELKAINRTATADQHFQLAVNITETCYQAANGTKTKLLPGTFMQNVTIKAIGLLT
ncbi:PREDICTED: mannosyl-oligosaccharide alpha-1,2-mannosidase IA-like [Rhagoletis zephyria]|uniref:mannosyl-oligosaccharide alpha-1,2-mannosidase IA-like n=1 Tax=Rhagoletis zephyria TaxID=28612 RepID=UPI000811250F|nr:PREDICTED: mannosyl-oligosaccharide alpha-1,2-mannosidase IA-like [Rhagoletis zephyria]